MIKSILGVDELKINTASYGDIGQQTFHGGFYEINSQGSCIFREDKVAYLINFVTSLYFDSTHVYRQFSFVFRSRLSNLKLAGPRFSVSSKNDFQIMRKK